MPVCIVSRGEDCVASAKYRKFVRLQSPFHPNGKSHPIIFVIVIVAIIITEFTYVYIYRYLYCNILIPQDS